MSRKRNAKLVKAVLVTAPVVLLFSNAAHGVGTWTGAVSSSWGDPANWLGSPIPPGDAAAGNGTRATDVFIGNNSTVNLGGYLFGNGTTSLVISRFRLG